MASRSGKSDPGVRWLVTTQESEYTLDIRQGLVTRRPITGGRLRADRDWVPLLAILALEVGQPMALLLDVRGDGRSTIRVSTPVVRIRRW